MIYKIDKYKIDINNIPTFSKNFERIAFNNDDIYEKNFSANYGVGKDLYNITLLQIIR